MHSDSTNELEIYIGDIFGDDGFCERNLKVKPEN